VEKAAVSYWIGGRCADGVLLQNLVVNARRDVLGEEHVSTLMSMIMLKRMYRYNAQVHGLIKLDDKRLREQRKRKSEGEQHIGTQFMKDDSSLNQEETDDVWVN
jgi:hypothetical protein